MQVSEHVAKAELSAVITRADGTIEDLGVIDSTEKKGREGFRADQPKGRLTHGDCCYECRTGDPFGTHDRFYSLAG